MFEFIMKSLKMTVLASAWVIWSMIVEQVNCEGEHIDFFYNTLYLKPKDKFELTIDSLITTSATSINFSTDIPDIPVPGVPQLSETEVFKMYEALNPGLMQCSNNICLVMDSSGLKFIELIYEKKGYQKLTNNVVQTYLQTIEGTWKCHDVSTNRGSQFLVLCSMEKEDSLNKSKYKIFIFDLFTNQLTNEIALDIRKHKKPSIKFVATSSKNPGLECDKTAIFAIFDRENDELSRFGINKKFFIIQTCFKTGVAESTTTTKPFYFDSFLFNEVHTKIKLMNVMIQYKDMDPKIYFYLKYIDSENVIQQVVYVCKIYISKASTEIEIADCSEFKLQNIQFFFLKNDFYVFINKQNFINFCYIEIDSCKSGKIDQNWQVSNLFIEEHFGVAVMKIKGTNVVMTMDFSRNLLTWFYDDFSLANQIFVTSAYSDSKPYIYFALFEENQLKMRPFTFRNRFKIEGSFLSSNERFMYTLDNEKFFDVKLKLWEGSKIIDIYDNKVSTSTATADNAYKVKLGFAGSNLLFTSTKQQTVQHYNPISVSFTWKSNINVSEDYQFFSYFGKNIFFFKNRYVVFECITNVPKFTYECTEKKMIEFAEGDSLFIFTSTEMKSSGDYYIFISLEEHPIVIQIYNINTNRFLQIDKTFFVTSTKCISNFNNIICKKKEGNIDTIEMFMVFDDQIIPQRELNIKLKKFFQSQSISKQIEGNFEGLEISEYDFDDGRYEIFYVKYSILFTNEWVKKIIAFNVKISSKPENSSLSIKSELNRFASNPNIKRDTKMLTLNSILLFINVNPKFDMFAYERHHFYEFEFLDVHEIYRIDQFNDMNLVCIIYTQRTKEGVFYSLFKITQNAVFQSIRKEYLGNIQKDAIDVKFSSITPFQVVIFFFSMKEMKIYRSYIYFEDGPFLLTHTLSQPVEIDGKLFKHNIVEGPEIFSYYTYKRFGEETILEKGSKNIFNIEELFFIEGNLQSVEFSDSMTASSLASVQLKKPFTLNYTSTIATVNFQDLKDLIITTWNDTIVFQSENNPVFFRMDLKEGSKPKEIVLKGTFGVDCNEVVILSSEDMACFFSHGGVEKLLIKNMDNDDVEERIFNVILPGKGTKVFKYDPSKHSLIYFRIGINHNFIIYQSLNLETGNVETDQITKVNFSMNDIKINDFHLIKKVSKHLNISALIVFDQLQNKIFFYNFDLTEQPKKDIRILSKNFSLDKISRSFRNITCIETQKEDLVFYCRLMSFSRIDTFEISVELNQPFSKFAWKVKPVKSQANMFHHALVNDLLQLGDDINEKHYIIYNKNINTESNKLYLYNQNFYSNKSYARLELETDAKIRNVYISTNYTVFIIFYLNGELQISNYGLDDYTLIVNPPDNMKDFKCSIKFNFEIDRHEENYVIFNFKKPIDLYNDRSLVFTVLTMIGITIGLSLVIVLLILIVKVNADRNIEIFRAEALKQPLISEPESAMSAGEQKE